MQKRHKYNLEWDYLEEIVKFRVLLQVQWRAMCVFRLYHQCCSEVTYVHCPSLYQFTGRAMKLTAIIIVGWLLSTSFKVVSSTFSQGYFRTKLLGIIGVGFDVTGQLWSNCFIRQILEKKREYNGTVHQLFIDFKKAYDSVREVLYSILLEFGTPMKLVRLVKMCLNET
jgi:hypothetical protein